MHMSALPTCMSVNCVHVWCQQRSEEDVRSFQSGVIDSCEPLHECWESNPGPL